MKHEKQIQQIIERHIREAVAEVRALVDKPKRKPYKRLTAKQQEELLRDLSKGSFRQDYLAKKYGVSNQTVSNYKSKGALPRSG